MKHEPRGNAGVSLAGRVLTWAHGAEFDTDQARAMFGPRVTAALYDLRRRGLLERAGLGLWRPVGVGAGAPALEWEAGRGGS
jgi:hypothetical protein